MDKVDLMTRETWSDLDPAFDQQMIMPNQSHLSSELFTTLVLCAKTQVCVKIQAAHREGSTAPENQAHW